MIKIGVDARSLSRPITGVGRYTYDMCRQLALNPNLKLNLYSPAPILPEYREPFHSCNIREFKTPKNGLIRQVWGETVLPYWAHKDGVDLLWGPSHRLPRINLNGCKTVVTIHDLVWKFAGETMKPMSRILERIQMPHSVKVADRIAVSSTSTCSDLNSILNVGFDKMDLVYPAMDIDPPNDLPKQITSIDDRITSPKFILFVGTLEPRKNLIRLLKAYSDLEDTYKNKCHLVIVGGKGWGGQDLPAMVVNYGLQDHVHLMGYQNERSLQYLYSKAHVLAMPSTYEGFGIPISEAMKYGTPALVGENSSLIEAVGDAGLLVDATNTQSISNGLCRLISDDNLYGALAAKTRQQIQKFDAKKSAEALNTVFTKAVKH
jgi:glycosyltransferase involved in cell wall biosynthesis